jgi:hypothetical protein
MEEIIAIILSEYQNWENSPERQKSGYQFEKSFTEMWQCTGQKVFQKSIGEIPKDKNAKKNSKQFGAR